MTDYLVVAHGTGPRRRWHVLKQFDNIEDAKDFYDRVARWAGTGPGLMWDDVAIISMRTSEVLRPPVSNE